MPISDPAPINIKSSKIIAYKIVFWDFDGVIKDSVGSKSDAFESLFLPYGKDLAARVRQHHEKNGGISRYEKIPIYLSWVNKSVTPEVVDRYCQRFASVVEKSVIASPWVPGIHNYIVSNFQEQVFVLVTATPLEEIQAILHYLDIAHCFKKVFGSPTKKYDAIMHTLSDLNISPHEALMIGDSESDLTASSKAGVNFLLRRNNFNAFLQHSYNSCVFDDLIDG
jgi:phosphoglycolate phosphatase-like HAD superfamily hydrolase